MYCVKYVCMYHQPAYDCMNLAMNSVLEPMNDNVIDNVVGTLMRLWEMLVESLKF